MKITVGIFDGSTAKVRYEEIEYDFDVMYKIIGCDTICISHLGEYTVFLDDSGKLKDNPLETCIVYSGNEIINVFVGTIIIAKTNTEGEITSLSPKDMQKINSFQMVHWYQRHILTNIVGLYRG